MCKQQTRQTEHFVYALIFHKFKIKGSKDIFCAFNNLIYLLNIKHKCVEIHKHCHFLAMLIRPPYSSLTGISRCWLNIMIIAQQKKEEKQKCCIIF